MPVDLTIDLQRVAKAAAQIHGLDAVCMLFHQIITTAQNMKHYTSRFDALTFFVSNSLISIAELIRRMQKNTPETLTILLKQYEVVLHNVFKLVRKYSKSWRITVVITAGIREIKIGRLERRLRRIQRSIFTLLDESMPGMAPTMEPRASSSKRKIATDNPSSAPFEPQAEEASSHSSPPMVTVDLPGKIILFDSQYLIPQRSDANALLRTRKPKYDSLNVPNLTGRIKIVRGPLLAGGFCDIYVGELMKEQGSDSEAVAMKMLRVFNTSAHIVRAKKKFRDEVSLWCSLKHLHVLPFYGTCEFDEFRLFMVSPWADGGSSLEYLRKYPSTDRGKLLWETASALEYLHSGKDAPQIVHGDLKADNVLVSASGDALLCDFGLSRFVEEIVSQSGSSSAGRAGGHARFMAPELLLPPKDGPKISKATPESDVFAFGSLMLQIFTECLPFGELSEAHAIINLANGQTPRRPVEAIVLHRGLGDYMWTVVTNCWKFKPSERPSMKEIMERLEARPRITLQILAPCPREITGNTVLGAPTSDNAKDGSPQFWAPPLLQLRPPTPPDDTGRLLLEERAISRLKSALHRTPPKIWAEIAYHIPRFHLRTWLSISSFHRSIARQHIFRTINIYFGGDNYDYNRGLDIFTRVRRDSNFARVVKTLRIHWSYEKGDVSDTLRGFLYKTLPAFQGLTEFEWIGFPGMQPEMVQDLLATHPKLHGLGFVGWHFDAQGVSGFRGLRNFTLRVENDDGFADMAEVRAVLDRNQDTLLHLTLGASLIGHHSWVPALQSLAMQKLTRLDLVDTQISASVLMRVSFAPNLQSLTLHGTFEKPNAVNVVFGSDRILDGWHRLLPHLQAFRFIMVGRENEVDVALFESILSFLRQRSQLRRLDLGNCPWELVRKVLPELSGLRVLRLRMSKLDDSTAKDVVESLPWGMLAIHVSVASSYQPADVALNVYAWHFSRFPLLSILHLESEFPRSLLERFNFRGDDAAYPWMAQAKSIAECLPSLDFVGWQGVHYVVVRGEETRLIKLQRSPTRRKLDGGQSVDLGSEDARWLERKDVPISYEMSGLAN